MTLRKWVKLPTKWIHDGGLKDFHWKSGQGSKNLASLMILMVIAHNADDDSGIANITYDCIAEATSLSRAKISDGLKALKERNLIARLELRSDFQLCNYSKERDWGKLPAKGLYIRDVIETFKEFHLRRRSELDALKIYYLLLAMRDNKLNTSEISYDKIIEYTGISRSNIKPAISVLSANNLIHVENITSRSNKEFFSNVYRLAHIDPYNHRGTTGRQTL